MRHDGDTIYREDVINTLADMHCKLDEDGYAWIIRSDALARIDALPPAQPEIIRCRECKYAKVADKEDTQDEYTCQFHRGSIWFSGSYCSWAERRTDG